MCPIKLVLLFSNGVIFFTKLREKTTCQKVSEDICNIALFMLHKLFIYIKCEEGIATHTVIYSIFQSASCISFPFVNNNLRHSIKASAGFLVGSINNNAKQMHNESSIDAASVKNHLLPSVCILHQTITGK